MNVGQDPHPPRKEMPMALQSKAKSHSWLANWLESSVTFYKRSHWLVHSPKHRTFLKLVCLAKIWFNVFFVLFFHFSPAVLYPAIPEVQMDAIMKMSEAIQGQGSAVKAPAPKQDNEEPLKLKSISELTPQENPSW